MFLQLRSYMQRRRAAARAAAAEWRRQDQIERARIFKLTCYGTDFEHVEYVEGYLEDYNEYGEIYQRWVPAAKAAARRAIAIQTDGLWTQVPNGVTILHTPTAILKFSIEEYDPTRVN